jgi:hypothetical protein
MRDINGLETLATVVPEAPAAGLDALRLGYWGASNTLANIELGSIVTILRHDADRVCHRSVQLINPSRSHTPRSWQATQDALQLHIARGIGFQSIGDRRKLTGWRRTDQERESSAVRLTALFLIGVSGLRDTP